MSVHSHDVFALSFLRRDCLDLSRELGVCHWIDRPVLHLAACWIFPEEVVPFPIRRRPDWSRNKPAPAIWTDISQNAFDTGHAEGALIGADTRLKRVRRQRLVAMLAGRSEFKHAVLEVKLPILGHQWLLEPSAASVIFVAVDSARLWTRSISRWRARKQSFACLYADSSSASWAEINCGSFCSSNVSK
jgi:hypothetical protein